MSSGSLIPSRCRGRSCGQFLADPPHDGAEIVLLQRPADAEPVEPAAGRRVQRQQVPGGLPPQVLVLRALHHGEQRLIGPADPLRREPPVLVDAPLRPGVGAVHRPFLIDPGVHQGGALVEGEDDVRTELVLDAHGDLRGEPVHRAVQVRLERHPVVVDLGQAALSGRDDVIGLHPVDVHREHLLESGAEREHLKAARVGERRARPVHEAAKAAALLDDVRSRLQVEVVGVGQHRLGLERGHRLREHRLDGRLGADRDERRGTDLTVRGADHARAAERAGQPGADPEPEPRCRVDGSEAGRCRRGQHGGSRGTGRRLRWTRWDSPTPSNQAHRGYPATRCRSPMTVRADRSRP